MYIYPKWTHFSVCGLDPQTRQRVCSSTQAARKALSPSCRTSYALARAPTYPLSRPATCAVAHAPSEPPQPLKILISLSFRLNSYSSSPHAPAFTASPSIYLPPAADITRLATPAPPPSPTLSRPSRPCRRWTSGKELREAPMRRPQEIRRSGKAVPLRRRSLGRCDGRGRRACCVCLCFCVSECPRI